jgi:hypothetical protein
MSTTTTIRTVPSAPLATHSVIVAPKPPAPQGTTVKVTVKR